MGDTSPIDEVRRNARARFWFDLNPSSNNVPGMTVVISGGLAILHFLNHERARTSQSDAVHEHPAFAVCVAVWTRRDPLNSLIDNRVLILGTTQAGCLILVPAPTCETASLARITGLLRVPVSFACNWCAACGQALATRKLSGTEYDPHSRRTLRTPGFSGFTTCVRHELTALSNPGRSRGLSSVTETPWP